MDFQARRSAGQPLVKTKIIATLGPASWDRERLRQLAEAGVDLFRLNFAHGQHARLAEVVESIRAVSDELQQPLGILGDLAGPKIRLGTLPEDGISLAAESRVEFVRRPVPGDPTKLTCTYETLVDEVRVGDPILLADGVAALRVIETHPDQGRVVCVVEQPGRVRSRQGVNLPGVPLSTPSLTDKDREDLAWALDHELDYIGLSFVRKADDVRLLREAIAKHNPPHPPQIVAKIEKGEAVEALDAILQETDAVMVARGDLGVEVDLARVPTIQKRIIHLCNERRVPVITATQMLDSMQQHDRPTRAEVTDVANAVIDGSDAVMLSGETAVGEYPVEAVATMNRIAREAEHLVTSARAGRGSPQEHSRASLMTEAVTLGAATAAEHLQADMIVVATRTGRTAMAVSKQRSPVPILALTDRPEIARRMCLYWGVTPLQTAAVHKSPEELLAAVIDWGCRNGVLCSGKRLVLVGSTDWTAEGKNLMLVHAIP